MACQEDEKAVVLYSVSDSICTITLNRPHRLNAISPALPRALRKAVEEAERDDNVHCIVLTGAGRSFCAGYDLLMFAERPAGEMRQSIMQKEEETVEKVTRGENNREREREEKQRMFFGASNGVTWDPMMDFKMMYENTYDFMSLFRCSKPTIAMIKGHAVAGGSDIALCCDIVIMEDMAKIGYPPARVWGIPTTMMWVTKLGIEKAKYMLFTGNLIDGSEAKRIGLIHDCFPKDLIETKTYELAKRISLVPRNQLMMSKMCVNQAYESSIGANQKWASLFDGIARYSPEGMYFKQRAEHSGFHQAVKERDGDIMFIPPGVSIPSFSFSEMSKL